MSSVVSTTGVQEPLDTLSVKLHGVDNMLGHQLAVHEMAGLLGVAVAQVSLPPL